MRVRLLSSFAGAVLVLAAVVRPAGAYIHFPPVTMPRMCQISTAIRVLTVKKHNKEKGVIIYEAAETLKGKTAAAASFKHAIGKETKETKPIFDWVADGKQAVMFTIEGGTIACGYVFIDQFCYSVDYNLAGDFWLLIRVDPEMRATYYGTVDTLQKVARDLLAGKEVKVPVDDSAKPVSLEERRNRIPALNDIIMKNRQK
jgi:hypothetical protein